MDPDRVVFLRPTKSGTSGLTSIFKELTGAKGFTIVRMPNQGEAVPMGVIEGMVEKRPPSQYVRELLWQYYMPRPFKSVWQGHSFNFMSNLTSFHRVRTATITILREPISRITSEWAYANMMIKFVGMHGDPRKAGLYKVVEGPMLDLAGKMTFEECVNDERCTRELKLEWWCSKTTAMLCGFSPICTDMNNPLRPEAIELAKHNLEHQISSFGILSERDTFLSMLAARLPTFFEEANNTDPVISPDISLLNHDGENTGVDYAKPDTFAPETITRLREICRADLELYAFAEALFKRRADECLQ